MTLSRNRSFPKVVAHRGDECRAPEHTFASYDLCLDAGVDYLELDVRQSKDNRYFSFHDENLLRIAGDTREFGALSAAVIETIDAGAWFAPDFSNERIPSIEDVFRRYADEMAFYFDVKRGTDEGALIELILRYPVDETSFFWFEDPQQSERFRMAYPEYRIKRNLTSVEELQLLPESQRPEIVECSPDVCEGPLAEFCLREGIELMTNPNECSREQITRLASLGVTYINTDRPIECTEVR